MTITSRCKPVVKPVPAGSADRASTTAERLRALRAGIAARRESLPWSELKAYRDEGRR